MAQSVRIVVMGLEEIGSWAIPSTPYLHSPLPTLLFLENHDAFHCLATVIRVSDHHRHRFAVG